MIDTDHLSSASVFFGKTGSGKTTAAKGVVERFLAEGRPTCILDPTGVWWGLRLASNGKDVSGLNPVILGGSHADIPLTDSAGKLLASMVASRALPQTIIDLSDFSGGEINRFATAFFEELFRANREPLHLVLDEADTFAPQSPRPDQARMQGAIDKIARQGRVKGFRPLLITQRPQKIDKSVIAQVATLVAMKLTLPHDRKAVGEWMKGSADPETTETVLENLPLLPTGTGLVWRSDDGKLEKIQFPRATTFDSSRAPEIGQSVVEPTALSSIDLDAIRTALQIEAPEEKKSGKIVAVDKAQIDAAYERGFKKGFDDGVVAGEQGERERIQKLIAVPSPAKIPQGPIASIAQVPTPLVVRVVTPPKSAAAKLHPAGQKLLEALAQHAPAKWTWGQLGLLAGLKASGGHFNAGRKDLRDAGYITEQADLVEITDAGLAAAGEVPTAPSSPQERLEMWCSKLPAPAPDILRGLSDFGIWASVDMLAERLGKKPTGGHWNSGIAVLRNNGLIEVAGSDLRLSSIFRGRTA